MSDDDLDNTSEDWEESTSMVTFESAPEDHGPADQAYLIVLSGSRIGSMIRVEDGMTIGRSPQASLQVQDDGVSRLHVQLRQNGVEMLAEDLGSRNGTYVNGQRVSTLPLKDGDKIRIGTTTILKFSCPDKLEEAYQRELYDAALMDPLLKIYNRRHLTEQLRMEFRFAARHRTELALIMFDIDHFKKVNDTFGHLTGDQVLVGLTQVIRRNIRVEDLFARYGGEEFALLCRGLGGAVAVTVARRLRRVVEEARLIAERPDLPVTISLGVAALPDVSISDPLQLVALADRALYRAKAQGRNQVCACSGNERP